MPERTTIGAGTTIRGNLRGEGDIEIGGRVEGTVDITGEVILAAGASLQAGVRASRVTVFGNITGDIVADILVRLEPGSRVVGDIRAPSISIVEGASLRGRVETSDAPAREAQASYKIPTAAPVAERRPAVAPVKPAALQTPSAPAKPATPPRPAPAPATARAVQPEPTPRPIVVTIPEPPHREVAVAHHAERQASAEQQPAAEPTRPPPPVVPALRKPMKGSLRKTRGAE